MLRKKKQKTLSKSQHKFEIMKTLIAKILLSLVVVLTAFSFTACNTDSVYCKEVQVELINTTRTRPIYYSIHSKFCDKLIPPGEKVVISLGRKDIDLNRPEFIFLDYRYHLPGTSTEETL